MLPSFKTFFQTVSQLFRVDWAYARDLFRTEGSFWLTELAFISGALYCFAHLFRKRSLLSKPICFLTGHDWFDPYAFGRRSECQRCGVRTIPVPQFSESLEPSTEGPSRGRRNPLEPGDSPVNYPSKWSLDSKLPQVVTLTRKRKNPKVSGPTRFDRNVLQEEMTTVITSQRVVSESLKPSDTRKPILPSTPEDSEPS